MVNFMGMIEEYCRDYWEAVSERHDRALALLALERIRPAAQMIAKAGGVKDWDRRQQRILTDALLNYSQYRGPFLRYYFTRLDFSVSMTPDQRDRCLKQTEKLIKKPWLADL